MGRGGGNTLYAMALEADIPEKLKIAKLERPFKKLAKSLGIEISLRPFAAVEF